MRTFWNLWGQEEYIKISSEPNNNLRQTLEEHLGNVRMWIVTRMLLEPWRALRGCKTFMILSSYTILRDLLRNLSGTLA